MGLRLNHLSASAASKTPRGVHALHISGAAYFSPSGRAEGSADAEHSVKGFPGHADAAYIFSGSKGGTDGTPDSFDKTVFLGDVVISGSLGLGGGGDFLVGDVSEFEVPFGAAADDTLEAEPSLTYIKTSRLLKIGASTGHSGSISLGNGDLSLFNDGDDAGIITRNTHKLGLTGALSPAAGKVGAELGSDAGVILGQGGSPSAGSNNSANFGFIHVRALTANADIGNQVFGVGTDPGSAAVMVKSDGGGLLLSGSKQTKLYGKTGLIAHSTRGLDVKVNTTGSYDFGTTLDIDAGGAVQINSSGGAISIGNDAVAAAINLGTGAAARTIKVGNESGATALDLDAGTGGVSIDAQGTGAISIGAQADAGDVNVGTGTGARTISVGNAVSTTAAIAAKAVAVEIDAGTGGISLDAGAASNFTTSAGALTLKGAAGEDVGVSGQTTTLKGQLNVDEAATFDNNVTITGNLEVNGTTTTVNTDNMTVQDSIIGLGVTGSDGSFSNVGDRAIIFAQGLAATDAMPTFWWDGSQFAVAKTVTSPASGSVGTVSGYSNLKVGNLLLAGGLGLPDSAGNHNLNLKANEDDLDDNYDIVFRNTNSSKELVLSGNLVIEAASRVNQDLTSDATVRFSKVELDNASNHIDLDGSSNFVITAGSNITGSAAGGIHLDAGSNVQLDSNVFDFSFSQGATERLIIETDGTDHVKFVGEQDDKDFIFQLKDGGAETEIVRFVAATPGVTLKDATPVNLGDTTAFLKRGDAAGKVILGSSAANADAVVIQAANAGGGIDLEAGTHIDVTSATGKITLRTPLAGSGGNSDDDAVLVDSLGGGIKAVAAKSILLESIENQSDSIQIVAKNDDGGIDLSVGATPAVVMSLDADSIDISQKLIPTADNSLDLGAADLRFANIYTGDLNLRNDRGDWTLIE